MTRATHEQAGTPAEAGGGPDAALIAFVGRSGLVAGRARFERLPGGVSSDIWLVRHEGGPFCVKRALAQLRVAAEWHAPVERNAWEARWFAVVAAFMPESVPRILYHEAQAGMFAMQYLDPGRYQNWKALLMRGEVDVGTAAEVGRRLARIHAQTARSADLAAQFSTDAIFHAIRIEPYLLATARAHPDLRSALEHLAERTERTKKTLVHGDVSPKNILLGPAAPVFIDAECAWYGDPAFDLCFCLKHLLLKCLVAKTATHELLEAFNILTASYLAGVDWEERSEFEARAASLLPGLFLARVDGKSPAEYVTLDRDRELVRAAARPLLRDPPHRIAPVAEAWHRALREGETGLGHHHE